MLVSHLQSNFKGAEGRCGAKRDCTVGQTGGFEKRMQPLSPGVFVKWHDTPQLIVRVRNVVVVQSLSCV